MENTFLCRLSVSLTQSGPWAEVLDTTLVDSRQQQDPLPLQLIALNSKTSAQFVKFELLSWWGRSGGLQFFDIKRGNTIATGRGEQVEELYHCKPLIGNSDFI
jgi:hypothetical protein